MLVSQLNLGRGYPLVIFCHIVLVLPFVLRSVYVSLKNLEQRIELAAASLGASPLRVVWTITVPLILPGLFGGWLFAAILSFNEFTASLFITTQVTQTFRWRCTTMCVNLPIQHSPPCRSSILPSPPRC
jgi:putative spermidine/putrescine transport system permease protein